MLVAHPAALKSQSIKSLEIHERALIMADANVPSIMRLRDDVSIGRYRTLAFTEFEKLYQRNPLTAANVEGHIRAFVDEGYRHAVWEDSRMSSRRAFCLVIGAMTPQCYNKHYSNWQDSGFARRFIWLYYALDDPGILTEAIHRWQRIKFPGLTVLQMDENELPYTLSEKESRELQKMLDLDANTPYILLKKIAVVLKHSHGDKFMEILRDVAPCFKGEGGTLFIDRKFENATEHKSHHSEKARSRLPRGPVRRGTAAARRKAAGKKVQPGPRLEGERELPAMPQAGLGNNPAKDS